MTTDTSREIEISKDVSVRVDAEDYDLVRNFPAGFSDTASWQIQLIGNRKLVLLDITRRGERERIYLHHIVLGMICDEAKARVRFLNGKTLDCRKENLVFSKSHSRQSSEISFRERDNTWASHVSFKSTLLGRFATEYEALTAQTEARIAIVKLLSELRTKFREQEPPTIKNQYDSLVQSVKLAAQQEKEANPFFGLGKKK